LFINNKHKVNTGFLTSLGVGSLTSCWASLGIFFQPRTQLCCEE